MRAMSFKGHKERSSKIARLNPGFTSPLMIKNWFSTYHNVIEMPVVLRPDYSGYTSPNRNHRELGKDQILAYLKWNKKRKVCLKANRKVCKVYVHKPYDVTISEAKRPNCQSNANGCKNEHAIAVEWTQCIHQ